MGGEGMAESERSSPFMGVTRRDFLAYCAVVCATIGVGEAAVPELAMALERLAKRPNVVWSCFGECLGCSVSLLQNTAPTVPQLVLRQISLQYHEAVMAPAGFQAEKSLNDMIASKDFYWVAEGAIPTTPPEACMIAGKTAGEIAMEFYKSAKAVASPRATARRTATSRPRHPTRPARWASATGCAPRAACPTRPWSRWRAARATAKTWSRRSSTSWSPARCPTLDAEGRPLLLYGQTIHENCERRGHFEAGEFVETFGDEGSHNGWCLFKMGCKGPVTYAPCPMTRWNDRVSWCVHNGPCTGCSERELLEQVHARSTSRSTTSRCPGLGGVDATTLGLALVRRDGGRPRRALRRPGRDGPPRSRADAADDDAAKTGKDDAPKGGDA